MHFLCDFSLAANSRLSARREFFIGAVYLAENQAVETMKKIRAFPSAGAP
jgi:hypothetical protein